MTSRGVLLRLVMDSLGITPKLTGFSARLRLQKAVYLLQRLGLGTNFSYNWYLYGPYSPGLTMVAFEEVAKPLARGDKTFEGYSLSRRANGKLQVLKDMTARSKEVGLSQDRWLELLASMHFYRHEMYFPPNEESRREDPNWLYEQLPRAKRRIFKKVEAVKAAEVLRQAEVW